MAELSVQVLGGFTVLLDNQLVADFRSVKARALLAYLATEPDRDHPRAQLANLFWGEHPERSAKTNLRIELSGLKKLLDDHPALVISRQSVRLRSDAATVDIVEFQRALKTFYSLSPEMQVAGMAALSDAVVRYTGEFLAGHSVPDAPEFEAWQLLTQERVHQQILTAMTTLQQHYAATAEWTALAATAHRQLQLAPWSEPAHRYLMQALAAQGQTQAALAQFDRCRQLLQDELGVEPSPATVELAQRLAAGSAVAPPARHNLTRSIKPLVGRTEEVAHAHRMVRTQRLVTLLGLGGVGKSHLAQVVARTALPDFPDGVWFIPLADVPGDAAAAERVAIAVSAAMGIFHGNPSAPLEQLLAHLHDKRCLLVLDNCEQLADFVEFFLTPLLERTTAHVLVTTRRRLMFADEAIVRVQGLPETEAVTLFTRCAENLIPGFAQRLTPTAEQDIVGICRQVAGLPLGIELAASWVEHFTVAEIGATLAEIAIEPGQAGTVAQRHQTLTAVLTYSWRLLSPREQQLLARLTIFQGGFDRPAAEEVAGASLTELSVLIAHSLLQRVAAGRYELHPLIQEFAAGYLPAAQAEPLSEIYRRHYLARLITAGQTQRLQGVRRDFANMRSAWRRTVMAGDEEVVLRAATSFADFCTFFGTLADGHALFAESVARFEQADPHPDVLSQLLAQQAVFARAVHGMGAAADLQHRLIALTEDASLKGKMHLGLANHYAEVGVWEETEKHFATAEALALAADDRLAYIETVCSRIHVEVVQFRADYAHALAQLQHLLRELDDLERADHDDVVHDDDPQSTALLRYTLNTSLGLTALRWGDYALAMRTGRAKLAALGDLVYGPKRVHSLLDLALAETFAGLCHDATAHNREALALAEAMHANDDIGLLQANLCLSLRQCGEYEQSLTHGMQAAELLHAIGIRRMEGQARNRVGHTLLAMKSWEKADDAYRDALAVWAPLNHPNHVEAVAGRAVALWQRGRRDEALACVHQVLGAADPEGFAGMVEPVLFGLNCAVVLEQSGETGAALAVLRQTQRWVMTTAARISDAQVRNVFLHVRPDSQRLAAQLHAHGVPHALSDSSGMSYPPHLLP